MVDFLSIDHPAVEFPLAINEDTTRFIAPQDTTLFFWGAITLGTSDRIAPLNTDRGSRQYAALEHAYPRISISLFIEGESIPLESNIYKMDGYRGRMYWIACLPEKLPISVKCVIETTGEEPIIDSSPAVLWTNQGQKVSWGTSVESRFKIIPSSLPASRFPTKRENLWGRHTVYIPIRQPDSKCSNLVNGNR